MPPTDRSDPERPRRSGEGSDASRESIATQGPAVPERVEDAKKLEPDTERDPSSIH